ncbi:MAG: diadenylate cyclase CdaA [Geobacteraceae bacterium]|nr:diadenylate cyclase CdaA [Geobacteraceae bacterium]
MTDFLHNIGWLLDFLDIVLVACLVYRVILLLKGTVSTRFILAFALIIVLSIFSSFAGLRTLSWLSENFLGSFIVILVVVFQHDIRRALVSARRNRLGTEHGQGEVYEVIEELASAAEALAQKKIGALVVLERDMPLSNFIGVGTEIDAKVTSELLSSIFLPYSPIHDGAVIIQKGKLTKAGCFLPLTQNPAVSKALGTRHRAAIGLTEVVDAVVVVVSEETGKISVVVGGRITRDLEPATLRKVLKKLLEPRWLS